MSLENIDPTTTSAWRKLTEHYNQTKGDHLKELFEKEPNRAAEFTRKWKDFLLDFSKNRITYNHIRTFTGACK